MATSGNFSTNRGTYELDLRLDWRQLEQDIPNNRTKLRLTLYFVVPSAGFRGIGYSANKSGSIQGQSFTANGGWISTSGAHYLARRDVWVNHNADGTKTVNLKANYNMNINWNGGWNGNVSVSGNATLNRIPRSAKMSKVNAAWLADNTYSGTVTGMVNEFTYTIEGYVDNERYWTKTESGSGSKTVSFSPTESDRNLILSRITNRASAQLRFDVITKDSNGRTVGGRSSSANTLRFNSSYSPNLGQHQLSLANTKNGKNYANYTHINFTIGTTAPSGKHGATIASIEILDNDAPIKRLTTSELSRIASGDPIYFTYRDIPAGAHDFAIRTTDSRGLSGKQIFTTTRYFVENKPPQVLNSRATRNQRNVILDIGGRSDNDGLTYTISYKGSGDTSVRYHKNNASLTRNTDGTFRIYETVPYLSDTKSYQFLITITDSLNNTITISLAAGTADVPLGIGRYGIGAGKIPVDNGAHLQVGNRGIDSEGDIKMKGKSLIYFETIEEW